MPKKALEIKNLHKVYNNEFQALKGLSFSVEEGEFFALLGPNGAGKTSLISLMAGVNRITSGQIKIFGRDIETAREETKFLLGIVPQEISFDSFFTVNEVLTLQSGYYGIKNNQAYIDEILEKLGLQDKKHTNNKALSGGMKRRLLIAQALVHKPKLVVLDEPTAGVDVELRHSLWTYMRELNKQGTTILLTTHYLEEAENLCKRTAIINKGQLVALDQTKKLIRDMGSRKEMTLNFTKKITTIPEKLKPFDPQKIDTHDLKITFDTSQMDQVFTALKGLPLNDIDLEGQNLEDVFIKLTSQN